MKRDAWSRKQKSMNRKRFQNEIINMPLAERMAAMKPQLIKDVQIGNKAEIIAEFADMLLADAENLALSRLAEIGSDLNTARADYRAALALYQKVQNAISQGKLARAKLKSFQEREGK